MNKKSVAANAVKAAKKALIIPLASVLFIALGLSADGASAGEVAFVDVAQVISQSAPGKEGQKIVDDLRAELNTRFETFSKTEHDQQKVRERQIELNNTYAQEHMRVTALLAERLRSVTEKWLAANKKGYTSVVPKASALAVNAGDDVSKELLELMNKEKIDFAAKQ